MCQRTGEPVHNASAAKQAHWLTGKRITMELPVVDVTGKKTETLVLDDAVWTGPVNTRLLSQVIRMYRSNQRAGTASTKTRGDVSGGGKKPWKQKHTGRARAGSNTSPLWPGGGRAFGPRPRDYRTEMPKSQRRKSLVAARP